MLSTAELNLLTFRYVLTLQPQAQYLIMSIGDVTSIGARWSRPASMVLAGLGVHLATDAYGAAGDEDDLTPAAHQRVQLLHQRAQAAQRQPVVRVPRHHRRPHLQQHPAVASLGVRCCSNT